MQAVGFVVFVWAEGWRATLLVVPLLQPDSGATAVLVDKLDPARSACPSDRPEYCRAELSLNFSYRCRMHGCARQERRKGIRDFIRKSRGLDSQNVSL